MKQVQVFDRRALHFMYFSCIHFLDKNTEENELPIFSRIVLTNMNSNFENRSATKYKNLTNN